MGTRRGIQPGYEAVISFDGTNYPGNPSMPPARPVKASKEKGSSQQRKIAFHSTKSEKLMRMRFAASVLVMAVLGVAILVGVSFGQQRDASQIDPVRH